MIIVLIIITILAIITLDVAATWDRDRTAFFAGLGAIILGIIDLIIVVNIITIYTDGYLAKNKIEMYQEENTKIENEVSTIVENYKDYEKDTFTGLKTASPTTLVSLFPELKSNELVNRQIDVYLENNKKIKELKEKQIEMKIAKWLLYFGN